MRDSEPVEFIRACTENMSVQSSLIRYLELERGKILERCADSKVDEETYRLQGEARYIRRLAEAIKHMTKMKGQVVDEQPRIQRVR